MIVNELLARLIEIANLAPLALEMPNVYEPPDTVLMAERLGDGDAVNKWQSKLLGKYPKPLRDYILSGNGGCPFNTAEYETERRYFIVREAREKLRSLIIFYRKYMDSQSLPIRPAHNGEGSLYINLMDRQRGNSFDWHMTHEHSGIQGIFGDESVIHFTIDPFIEALKGVEARRIRECQKCRRIFWAGRLDMTCCSTRCAKVLRTKNWRVNVSVERKKQYAVERALRESKEMQLSKRKARKKGK